MKYYIAPLEGVTGRVFRITVHELYGEYFDKYFTPFFMPHEKRKLDKKDFRELDPSANRLEEGLYLVPQILTENADDFLFMAKGMTDLGYKEININIGCPSSTVLNKGRGAGFLSDVEGIDRFLYRIFEKADYKISVKTRIGRDRPEEFCRLLEVYNKYPLEELIIHPRTGRQKYGGKVHMDLFFYALQNSKNKICYNGDMFLAKDTEQVLEKTNGIYINNIDSLMFGRGIVGNPALVREVKGGPAVSGEELYRYLVLLRENYRKCNEVYKGNLLLNKSKEAITFVKYHLKDKPEQWERTKQLLQCRSLEEYVKLEREIFLMGDDIS